MIQKIDGHHINKFIENKTKPMNARASGRVISRFHRVKTEFFSVWIQDSYFQPQYSVYLSICINVSLSVIN